MKHVISSIGSARLSREWCALREARRAQHTRQLGAHSAHANCLQLVARGRGAHALTTRMAAALVAGFLSNSEGLDVRTASSFLMVSHLQMMAAVAH